MFSMLPLLLLLHLPPVLLSRWRTSQCMISLLTFLLRFGISSICRHQHHPVASVEMWHHLQLAHLLRTFLVYCGGIFNSRIPLLIQRLIFFLQKLNCSNSKNENEAGNPFCFGLKDKHWKVSLWLCCTDRVIGSAISFIVSLRIRFVLMAETNISCLMSELELVPAFLEHI